MGTYKKIAEFLYNSGVCGYVENESGAVLIKKIADRNVQIGFFGEDVFEILKKDYNIRPV